MIEVITQQYRNFVKKVLKKRDSHPCLLNSFKKLFFWRIIPSRVLTRVRVYITFT